MAPVLGITVMAEGSWSRIGQGDQEILRASAKRLEQELLEAVAAQEQASIEQMQQRGLTVVEFDDATKASFRKVADELTASWRGNMIPAEVYDMAVRERDSFRSAR